MSERQKNKPIGSGLPVIDTGEARATVRRKKKSTPNMPWVIIAAAAGVVGIGVVVYVLGTSTTGQKPAVSDPLQEKRLLPSTPLAETRNRPPVMDPIGEQSVELGKTLDVAVHAVDPDTPPRKLEYRLLPGSPQGATIDPNSGRFSWTPDPRRVAPDTSVPVRVAAIEALRGGLGVKQEFTVRITPGEPMQKFAGTEHHDEPTEPSQPTTPSVSTTPVEPSVPTAAELARAERKKLKAELLELYDKDKVFAPKTYPTFRRIYSRLFELDHADSIERAYGKNRDTMDEFFTQHPAIEEELYTAIDPKVDNVDEALKIFATLVTKFPESFPNYSEAAIATAVTWDAGPRAFSYAGHQVRTQSTMPKDLIDGIDNFEYLVGANAAIGRRVCAMPWEFLVHVVDHPTPLAERNWAVTNYLDKQVEIGKCYKDVPYDTGLRDQGGSVAKLKGHDYTLPEIRDYGGVCAMQADFASRVAKSLGVPGFYTGGQSVSLDNHAWIVWVELYNVGKGQIQFDVKSFGRYDNDKYYVGSLKDPKTQARITDRQLELRLHNIGFGVQNKRHAELVMRTYPLYCKERKLDVDARLHFLGKVIDLSQGTESAWLEIARMSATGEITMKQNRQMKVVFNQLFKTFAYYPDFTWTVFNDLITYRDKPKEVAKLYEQLIGMYIQAQRPDLGCEAVLRYADYAAKQGGTDRAIDALAGMALAFPDEGRYVPKLLDRLESFAGESPKTRGKLVVFYKELIPKIPKYRNKIVTKYCVTMYERAIRFFQSSGETELAAAIQTELDRLKAEEDARKNK